MSRQMVVGTREANILKERDANASLPPTDAAYKERMEYNADDRAATAALLRERDVVRDAMVEVSCFLNKTLASLRAVQDNPGSEISCLVQVQDPEDLPSVCAMARTVAREAAELSAHATERETVAQECLRRLSTALDTPPPLLGEKMATQERVLGLCEWAARDAQVQRDQLRTALREKELLTQRLSAAMTTVARVVSSFAQADEALREDAAHCRKQWPPANARDVPLFSGQPDPLLTAGDGSGVLDVLEPLSNRVVHQLLTFHSTIRSAWTDYLQPLTKSTGEDTSLALPDTMIECLKAAASELNDFRRRMSDVRQAAVRNELVATTDRQCWLEEREHLVGALTQLQSRLAALSSADSERAAQLARAEDSAQEIQRTFAAFFLDVVSAAQFSPPISKTESENDLFALDDVVAHCASMRQALTALQERLESNSQSVEVLTRQRDDLERGLAALAEAKRACEQRVTELKSQETIRLAETQRLSACLAASVEQVAVLEREIAVQRMAAREYETAATEKVAAFLDVRQLIVESPRPTTGGMGDGVQKLPCAVDETCTVPLCKKCPPNQQGSCDWDTMSGNDPEIGIEEASPDGWELPCPAYPLLDQRAPVNGLQDLCQIASLAVPAKSADCLSLRCAQELQTPDAVHVGDCVKSAVQHSPVEGEPADSFSERHLIRQVLSLFHGRLGSPSSTDVSSLVKHSVVSSPATEKGVEEDALVNEKLSPIHVMAEARSNVLTNRLHELQTHTECLEEQLVIQQDALQEAQEQLRGVSKFTVALARVLVPALDVHRDAESCLAMLLDAATTTVACAASSSQRCEELTARLDGIQRRYDSLEASHAELQALMQRADEHANARVKKERSRSAAAQVEVARVQQELHSCASRESWTERALFELHVVLQVPTPPHGKLVGNDASLEDVLTTARLCVAERGRLEAELRKSVSAESARVSQLRDLSARLTTERDRLRATVESLTERTHDLTRRHAAVCAPFMTDGGNTYAVADVLQLCLEQLERKEATLVELQAAVASAKSDVTVSAAKLADQEVLTDEVKRRLEVCEGELHGERAQLQAARASVSQSRKELAAVEHQMRHTLDRGVSSTRFMIAAEIPVLASDSPRACLEGISHLISYLIDRVSSATPFPSPGDPTEREHRCQDDLPQFIESTEKWRVGEV